MFIFFAGSQGFEKSQTGLFPLIKNRLVSQYYMSPGLDRFYLSNRSPDLKIEKLIMDSGAFSAWNKNVTIDFHAYIDYCLKYIDKINYIVNLDVIPASPGQKIISQEEIERSASLGYKNARKMVAAGIPREKLIHVFHQNENFKWLKRMVNDFPYIGLSPANDRNTDEKRQWLDQCMPYVTDQDGFPIVKFHGFAVTAHALMVRYPWFSVDSASWCQEAGRGLIYVPLRKDGKYRYDVMPLKVRIGFNSPREQTKRHFVNLPPLVKNMIQQYFDDKGYVLGSSTCVNFTEGMKTGGKSLIRFCRKESTCDGVMPKSGCIEKVKEFGVINKHGIRSELNAIYINDMENSLTPWPNRRYIHKKLTQGFNI